MSRTLWRPCCKTYRRFLHKKERGLPAFRWQTSWRRWRDSNSRAGFEPTYRISSADPSTAWVHLQIYVISLVPTRRPIQPVEIGKNNRIEQTPIHDLNLPANPHGYWLFGNLDFQSGNMISSQPCYDHFDAAAYGASTHLSYHKFSRRATGIAAYFSLPPHEMIGRRESL